MSELFPDHAPTPPLDQARAALEADRHLWWKIGCGHHENLFDAACEEIDRLTGELAAAMLAVTVTLEAEHGLRAEVERLTQELATGVIAALDAEHGLRAWIERLKDQLALVRGIARLCYPEDLARFDAEQQ